MASLEEWDWRQIPGAVQDVLRMASGAYAEWWIGLYHHSPVHLAIETTLLVAILYILLVKRAYDPAKRGYGARSGPELSAREQEELIADWQPEPLVSKPKAGSGGDGGEGTAPLDFMISEYVATAAGGHRNLVVRIGGGDERPKVSFCSADFLGLGASAPVRAAALSTLDEYTLGSCGPRGFYGTTRKHLELEAGIAGFMGTPESITYSDAASTVGSAIPAFAKRGDILLVDAGVNHAVVMGARLSRSKLLFFRHNDMGDLEAHLEAVRATDAAKRDGSLDQRRFIVIEGLYANYGDLCPLPEVLRLAREFRWRVILDDSLGVGVLGATGRGVVEHYGFRPLDIDVLVGSMSATLGSVGGFCVGAREVVDHQRLSGAGYCFSASLPPFLCATASAALAALQANPGLPAALRARAREVHAALEAGVPGLRVVSDPQSPVKHLLLTVGPGQSLGRAPAAEGIGSGPQRGGALLSPGPLAAPGGEAARVAAEENALLRAIVLAAAERGVLLARTHYVGGESLAPRPTLKLFVTLGHTPAELGALVKALAGAAQAVLGAHLSTTAAVAMSSPHAAAAAAAAAAPAGGPLNGLAANGHAMASPTRRRLK